MTKYRMLKIGEVIRETDERLFWADAGLMGGYLDWETVPSWMVGNIVSSKADYQKTIRRLVTPFSELTEFDWLQIESAASGRISGTSAEWPALRAAIEKITGKPLAWDRTASWLQGFCEGVLIQRKRTGETDDNKNS